jgi:RNA polymerase sigma factor (sigma-70 family)
LANIEERKEMTVAKTAPLPLLSADTKSATASMHADSTATARATARLTRRMAGGDEDSYREFYDLYSHRLFGYLFVITRGDEHLAREVLQQTMIRVAKYVRAFNDEEIFWKWLTNLARSAFIDETRKHNRYLAALEKFWNALNGHVHTADSVANIADPLEQLEEPDRLLLTKKYLEGLSLRELAEQFSVSEKAIESRLTRARAKVKQILSRHQK